MLTLIITTGYKCNNNCLFCYKDDQKINSNKSTKEIKRELDEAIFNNIQSVDFDGGEPTIRPDIQELIKYAKNIGFKTIVIVTNGRMFRYKNFCKEILKSGVTSILFSIHGHTAVLHNFLTRSPKSFEQAIQGLTNLKELKKQVTIGANIVITKQNYKYLDKIVKFLKEKGISLVHLICICPIGQAYKNYGIIPLFSEIVPFITEVIDSNEDIDIKVHNLPFCFMRNYERYIIPEAQSKDKREIKLPLKKTNRLGYLLRGLKIKLNFCEKCRYNSLCGGVWKNYLKIYGTKEFKMKAEMSKVRFSYTYIKTNNLIMNRLTNILPRDMRHKRIYSSKCILKNQKIFLPKKKKDLFYADNNTVERYELRDIIEKKNLQYIKKFMQIYVSKSDNWPNDLFRAELNKKCQKCLYFKRWQCAGYFIRSSQNVLEESKYEQLLETELRKLRGNVLDIGCGPVYHFKIFRHLAEKNKITYYGVDPNQEIISLLNSKIPKELRNNFKTIARTAENLEFPDNFFDTILVIRSYNHIFNLNKALTDFKRIIKNKGKLIVMDNAFFAIIKASESKNENKKDEHHRVHTSLQAIKELKRYGFRIIEHSPISKKESCWYIKCEVYK